MKPDNIIINGHFRAQQVTGVQQYTWEILSEFDKQNITYNWVQPPQNLNADALRQLWIQSVMPFKIPNNKILWSPTNVGPVFCENQVLTLHDIADQLHPEWYDAKYVKWRGFILPKLIKKVRSIITVSEYSKRTISEFFPQAKDKITAIYPGVRTDFFYPRGEEEIRRVKNIFELKKPYVLIVSSLAARKNIAGLINAWCGMPERIRREMNLVITGESARKFAFNMGEADDKSIRFTGYVKKKQLPVLYSGAQLFVYPSFFEGFGSPVIEAMACSTAVLTSSVTALKETSGPAATVNPYSVDEIRAAMLELLESASKRAHIAAGAREWATRFTWKQCAQETYKQLMQAH